MTSTEYQKIATPFKRDPQTNKLIFNAGARTQDPSLDSPTVFTDPAIAALQYSDDWFFTEKIDGTNIRVIWNGHNVESLGRTDNAQFSKSQSETLSKLFGGEDKETLFEQKFGATPAVLYGELYGAGVQKGGDYRSDLGFILFDVRVNDLWLHRDDVEDVAEELGLEIVPIILGGSGGSEDLWGAISVVSEGLRSQIAMKHSGKSIWAEGLVGTTYSGLLNRRGERVIVKVKHRDFF